MGVQTVELSIPVPRGMLFLYDHSASNVEIPAYSPDRAVAFTDTAISIATISELDGETKILLTDSEVRNTQKSKKLFSGQILVESGNICICVMGDEIIGKLASKQDKIHLEIYGDGKPFSETILIFVR